MCAHISNNNNNDDDNDNNVMMMTMKIIIINLIYISHYMIITYIQMQYVHI